MSYCLSTHPRVFWVRGEPLLRGMEWGKAFPKATDSAILRCITRASYYEIGGCKVTYEQMSPDVWDFLRQKKPLVLHLWRENLIRVAVSQIITGMVVSQRLPNHKAHTIKRLPQPQVTIPPENIIAAASRQGAAIDVMRRRLSDNVAPGRLLELTYADITGGEGIEATEVPPAVARTICDFLGVEPEPLYCHFKRVNHGKLSEILKNWDEVRAVVSQSRFAYCLEGQ